MLPTENPRNVERTAFPESGTFTDKAIFLLNYAVLAPSSHNTQPWLFKVHKNCIKLYADTGRSLSISDTFNRELVISCGCALGNLEVAANFFGLKCIFDYFPDERNSSHLVDISLISGHTITANDRRLFSAIKDRSTSRKSFLPTKLSESLCSYLTKEAENSQIELHLISEPKQRSQIADLVAEADETQFDDPAFREELSKWIRISNSQQHDGISADKDWTPGIMTKMNAMIIRRFDIGNGIAARDKEIAENSPVLALIATKTEEPYQWFIAGRMLIRVLLHLTASGMSVGYLNQAIEIVDIRNKLRSLMGVAGYPQLLIRLGRADHTRPTARRPLKDVVSTEV